MAKAASIGPDSWTARGSRAGGRRRALRVAFIYAIGAVIVLGWAAHLGISLPDVNMAGHWSVGWVGPDVLIVFALARTAWCAGRGDRRVVTPAVATAALLIVDAWMDVSARLRYD
jgi:hypothetical protein